MKQIIMGLIKNLQFLQKTAIVLAVFVFFLSISNSSKKKVIKEINSSYKDSLVLLKNDKMRLLDSIKYLNNKMVDANKFKSENIKDVIDSYDRKIALKDRQLSFLLKRK